MIRPYDLSGLSMIRSEIHRYLMGLVDGSDIWKCVALVRSAHRLRSVAFGSHAVL